MENLNVKVFQLKVSQTIFTNNVEMWNQILSRAYFGLCWKVALQQVERFKHLGSQVAITDDLWSRAFKRLNTGIYDKFANQTYLGINIGHSHRHRPLLYSDITTLTVPKGWSMHLLLSQFQILLHLVCSWLDIVNECLIFLCKVLNTAAAGKKSSTEKDGEFTTSVDELSSSQDFDPNIKIDNLREGGSNSRSDQSKREPTMSFNPSTLTFETKSESKLIRLAACTVRHFT